MENTINFKKFNPTFNSIEHHVEAAVIAEKKLTAFMKAHDLCTESSQVTAGMLSDLLKAHADVISDRLVLLSIEHNFDEVQDFSRAHAEAYREAFRVVLQNCTYILDEEKDEMIYAG